MSTEWPSTYQSWSEKVFGVRLPVYVAELQAAASFKPGSPEFGRVWQVLFEIEMEKVEQYVISIRENDVAGDFVEFGVFQGGWLNRMYEVTRRNGLERVIWGFDSFEGLSKPVPGKDGGYWEEGMYACDIDTVRANIQAQERNCFSLVKGFFSDSLSRPDAQKLGKVAYARIDVDIYEPSLQALHFMAGRLSHGAILVFDDWPHGSHVSEGLALAEWIQSVPFLEFEFLFFGAWGHFYIRVWHAGKPRWTKP